MQVRRALAILLLAGAVEVPAAAAAPPPPQLFVLGDSLAHDSSPYLRNHLPGWEIEESFSFIHSALQRARDLRLRAESGVALPTVIHVSVGTGDDPAEPEAFRRAIRRVMRLAGRDRCVVWASIWRPRVGKPSFAALNRVLLREDAARANLRVLDWHLMVEAHQDWLVDVIHVNRAGNRARARALAREVRACRRELESPAAAVSSARDPAA
jgi:hypothetical protein